MSINFNKHKVKCEEFENNMKLLPQVTLELENKMKHSKPQYFNKTKKIKLTKRELEVLAYLVKGKNNQEIAQELYITITTVKAHVSSILNKLGAADRAEASYIVKQKNLLK